jgi:hypothetical protein
VTEGVPVIEADRRKQNRVNLEIVVEVTNRAKLVGHPNDVVRELAEGVVKRNGRSVKGEA